MRLSAASGENTAPHVTSSTRPHESPVVVSSVAVRVYIYVAGIGNVRHGHFPADRQRASPRVHYNIGRVRCWPIVCGGSRTKWPLVPPAGFSDRTVIPIYRIDAFKLSPSYPPPTWHLFSYAAVALHFFRTGPFISGEPFTSARSV